jgi:hypothetical protein
MGRNLAGLIAMCLLTAAAPARFIVTYDGGGNLNAYRQNFNLFSDRSCAPFSPLAANCLNSRAAIICHSITTT